MANPQNLILKEGTVLDPCASTTGWTASAGALAVANETSKTNKTTSLSFSVTSAGVAAYSRRMGLSLNLSDLENVEIIFKTTDRLAMSSIRISIENSGSNYFYCFVPVQANVYINNQNWYKARVSRSEFLSQGTPSWNTTIASVGIRVSGASGALPTVLVDDLSYNVKAIPKVLFTYDDGWQSVADNAAPIHQKYGQKFTTWVVSRFAQNNDVNYMKEATLNALYAAGHDIGNHSAGHDTYSETPLAELRQSYLDCRDYLRPRWPRAADHVCYPAGEFGDDLVTVLKELGVKTARTTVIDITATPVDNIHKIKTYALGSTTTRAQLLALLQRVKETGCSLHFMLHRVEATPIPPLPDICYPTAELDWLAGTVKSMGFDVVTISEWFDQLSNPRKRVFR